MLKNITPNTDLVINTLITSEDYSSDRDFFNKKILDFTTNNVVNNISDSEIYEYKPNLINSVNFNIFFLKYIQDAEINDLTMVMESDFNEHLINTKDRFNLVPTRSLAFNNIYTPKQSNSLVETELIEEIDRTKISNLLNKPYFVRDIIGESLLKKPENNGLPVFYNSFTFPFWSKRDLWLNDPLLYSNKPYFYNSFLLMEFFDSASNLNQNRIQSIPIFVNPRYNIFENPSNKQFTHERPCFNLKEGVEGFSFFFLNNYITNEFYVRFSFWDSLSGNQIPLLPSSTQEYDKKWLQNPDTFKQEARYLKYVLDYNNKTYKIYEFNSITNTYDLERNDFDLYELAFDNYFNLSVDRVPNKKPINAKKQITPTAIIDNPLKFDIKNLTFDYENTADFTRKDKLLINNYTNADTFLGCMASYLVIYQTFINNKLNSKEFTDFETKKIKIPLIEGEIDSASLTLSKFNAINIDDQSWRIRRIVLEDINITNGTKNFKFNLYNEINSNISDKKKYKLAEAIFESSPFNKSEGRPPFIFTEKLFDDFDIFEDLISVIESFFINYYKNDTVKAFIDDLSTLLKLDKKYYEIYTPPTPPPPSPRTLFNPFNNEKLKPEPERKERTFRNYRDFIKPLSNPNANIISYVHKGQIYELKIGSGKFVEFSIIKPVLINEYNNAKINDVVLYEKIKNLSKNFMIQFYNQQESNRVTSGGGIDTIKIPGTNITVNLPVEIPFSNTISNTVSNIPVVGAIFSGIFGNNTQKREQEKYDAFGNINKIALDRYFKKFNPLNHQELLETYISLAKRQYISPYYYFGNDVYIRGDVNSELIRSYSLGLILLLDGDNSLTIKENLKFDLILNVGKYFKHELDLEADINITGKSRISLINNDNEIKNIIIPINIVVKP